MDGEIRMSLCYLQLDIFSLQLDSDHLNKVEYDSPKANGVFVTHYLPPQKTKVIKLICSNKSLCNPPFGPEVFSVFTSPNVPPKKTSAEPQGLVGIRKR